MPSAHVRAAREFRDSTLFARDDLADALASATGRVKAASRRLTGAILGDRRIAEIARVFVSRHGKSPMPRDLADQYAPAVISAALWAMSGLPGTGKERRLAAVRHAAKWLPTANPTLLSTLAHDECAMSAQVVARVLDVSWTEREQLSLTLIGAADLSDDEYAARLATAARVRDATRKAQTRIAQGGMTAEERASYNAERREALERLASRERISISTVRRRIAAGELPEPVICKSRVRGNIVTSPDATFPNLDLHVERDGRALRASVPRPLVLPKSQQTTQQLSSAKFKGTGKLMNREHVEKLNNSPDWKAAYEAALVDGESIHGENHYDAIAYATTAADLAVARAADVLAEGERNLAEAFARHEAQKAQAAVTPNTVEPPPDPREAIATGWRKAFASVSGGTPV